MPCISPVRLKNPLFNNKDPASIERRKSKTKGSAKYIQDLINGFSRFIDVPCGRCYGCMRMRCNGWVFRHLCELNRASSAHFVTLTYSDENLPFSGTSPCFSKRDVQLFLKRLRKWLSKHYPDAKIKYHVAAEYGDTFGRPHYHLLLYGFPNDPDSLDQIPISWNLGNVDVGSVTEASIRYVVEYITQYYYETDFASEEEKPFALFSNGIGSCMYSDVAKYISKTKQPLFFIAGKSYKIPNSYLVALRDGDYISNYTYYAIKLNAQHYYESSKDNLQNSLRSLGVDPYRREISTFREGSASAARKYRLRKQGLK